MVKAFILWETLFLPSMIYNLITLSIYKGKSIRNEVKHSEIANLKTSCLLLKLMVHALEKHAMESKSEPASFMRTKAKTIKLVK